MPSININGINLSYTEKGNAATRPPVVLVHGFPVDSRVYAHQLEQLSKLTRVITPDLPGFGQSKTAVPFTITAIAETLHEMLKKIDALPCVFGGLSMGGYIALAFARQFPADLRGLILNDTRAEADTSDGKNTRNEMIEIAKTKGARAIADQMEPKMLSPKTLVARPEVVAKFRAMSHDVPAETMVNALTAMRDRIDYAESLASIAVPTLVIVGEDDAVTPPESAQTLVEKIPQATLARIADAGHLSPIDQPEAVTRAIEQFLGKL